MARVGSTQGAHAVHIVTAALSGRAVALQRTAGCVRSGPWTSSDGLMSRTPLSPSWSTQPGLRIKVVPRRSAASGTGKVIGTTDGAAPC